MGDSLFFLQNIRPIKIVPLSRLKFGYMKFYRVIYAVENKKVWYFHSLMSGCEKNYQKKNSIIKT